MWVFGRSDHRSACGQRSRGQYLRSTSGKHSQYAMFYGATNNTDHELCSCNARGDARQTPGVGLYGFHSKPLSASQTHLMANYVGLSAVTDVQNVVLVASIDIDGDGGGGLWWRSLYKRMRAISLPCRDWICNCMQQSPAEADNHSLHINSLICM
jgi:hypothetical protein